MIIMEGFMDIEEFYDSDDRKYELANNREFLRLFYRLKKKGYPNEYIIIEEFQRLINFIANWYEIKYPNRLFNSERGINEMRFNNYSIKTINLDMNDLLYQLSNKQLSILDCNYRGYGIRMDSITNNNGEIIEKKKSIIICVSEKTDFKSTFKAPSMYISVNHETGELNNNYCEFDQFFSNKKAISTEILNQNGISLNQLYQYLSQKYGEKYDLSELKKTIYLHEFDKTIRNYLLNLVSLKLLYSENTIPEYGYARAEKFIEEFNDYYLKEKNENLYLSNVEIEEIINKYLSHKIKVKVK